MKKRLFIPALTILAVLVSSYSYTSLPMDLIQAIQDKRIVVVVTSTGGYSGKCMALKVKNLTNAPCTFVIAAGTVFIPEDEGEQTILVPQKNVIVLQPAESKPVLVGGYCTELKDRSPQTSSAFTISKTTNQSLLDLIACIAPLKNLDESLIQQSVWCITDEQSPANVTSENTIHSKTVREFLFKRIGETDTWYTTKRIPEMTPDHSIVNTAMEVSGKIDIKATKPMELLSVVKNEAGEVVWKYPYSTSLPVGDIVFDFSLKVRNWKSGNYYIIYTCEGVELVHQKFTI